MNGTGPATPGVSSTGRPPRPPAKPSSLVPSDALEERPHQFPRVHADGNRDGQRAVLRQRPPGEVVKVVGRDDVDAGDVALLEHQAVAAGVHAVLRVLGDDHRGGDHGRAVEGGEDRHRQLEQVHLVALPDGLLYRRVVHHHRLDGVGHGELETLVDLGVGRVQRQAEAFPLLQQPARHRDGVAHGIFEQQRLIALRRERRHVPQVDRFAYVQQLVVFPQQLDVLPKSPVHASHLQTGNIAKSVDCIKRRHPISSFPP